MFAPRTPPIAAAILLVVAGALMPQILPAQTASAPLLPSFDAISVKVHNAGPGGINLRQPGGHVSLKSISLQALIAIAFDLPSLSQAVNTILGMPS